MPVLDLLNKDQYIDELIHKIKHLTAKDHLIILTMSLDFRAGRGKQLFQAIKAALNSKVNVIILLDANNFMYQPGLKFGPLFYRHKNTSLLKNSSFYRLKDDLLQLENLGAKIKLLNHPTKLFSSPFKGRNHIKLTVINNICYFGGFNLVDNLSIDSMMRVKDDNLSNFLFDFTQRLYLKGSVKFCFPEDIQKKFDNYELLIDKGEKKQSIIFDRAIKNINDASYRIILTCQFFPDSRLIEALNQAYLKGVKVQIIYNSPNKHDFPFNIVHGLLVVYMRYVKKISSELFNNQIKDKKFLHDKILITDDRVIYGSHNFVYAGLKYGTSELAIESQDKFSVGVVMNFIKSFCNLI